MTKFLRPENDHSISSHSLDLQIKEGKNTSLSDMSEEEMQEYFFDRICDIAPLDPESKFSRMTDVHAADLYIEMTKGNIVWNETVEQWMTYDEKKGIWKENNAAATLYAARIGRALERYYVKMIKPDLSDDDQKLIKVEESKVKRMLSARTISAYLSIVKSADNMHISSSDLDANFNIINCLNGELHLDDLKLHEHDPFSFCTKNTNVVYDPNAKSDVWNHAVAQYMCDPDGNSDPEKLKYFQKAIGYSIDGTQAQKKFFILWGRNTNNGKSTLMNAICNALGDYAKQTSVKTFCSRSRGSDGPTEGLANLSGSRLVAAAEAETDWPVDCELLKNVTGSDSIMVRALYGHEFRLVPTFKIWIHSNWIPNMTDSTIFDSGRVVVIPVDCQFTNENGTLDITMPDKLQMPDVAAAILAWIVEGLKEYRRDYSLVPPKEVEETIKDQKYQSNKIAQFVNECLEHLDGCNASVRNTYITYREWCKENGYSPLNRKRFLDGIRNLGIEVKHARDNAPNIGSGKSTSCLAGWAINSWIASKCCY